MNGNYGLAIIRMTLTNTLLYMNHFQQNIYLESTYIYINITFY